MKAPPSGGGAIGNSNNNGTAETSRSAPNPASTKQRCAGCGAAGHPLVIVYARAEAPPGAVLTPVFNWYADGRPALLCRSCRDTLARKRMTGRAR